VFVTNSEISLLKEKKIYFKLSLSLIISKNYHFNTKFNDKTSCFVSFNGQCAASLKYY
jgi:hypothetical protein